MAYDWFDILASYSDDHRMIAYLTIPELWISERISLQDPPQRPNSLFILITRVLRQTAVQILLNILRARRRSAFVLLESELVHTRVGETEVQGPGERFPHLAAETIGKTHLNETGTLRVS